jgi:hypothetical protein
MSTIISSQIVLTEFLQPEKPQLYNPYTDSDLSTLAYSVAETSLTRDMDVEAFVLSFPWLPYERIDRVNTVVHPIYREAKNPQYLPAVMIPTWVKVDPPLQLLRKYGIETEQDAIALMSLEWLDRHVPNFVPTAGDLLTFFEIKFEVLTSKRWDYIANTQIPLHRVFTLKNLPQSD